MSTRKGQPMALSDAPNGYKFNVKARSAGATGKFWSDRQKMEAVTSYLLLGSIPLVAATLKIPEHTLWGWKKTDWWHELTTEIKSEESLILSTKMKKIVDKSWDVVADRLENGEFIYDQKKGEIIRKPVSLRDAAKVAADSTNLREKLNLTQNFTVANEHIEEKLTKLATAFTNLAKGIVTTQAVEDITFVEGEENSVHDEWKEELSEREPTLQLETSTEKEQK